MDEALIIQIARFGDLVQTRRLWLSLVEKYRVHICVDRNLEDLAKILYPDTEIHCLHAHGKPNSPEILADEKVFRKLKGIKFAAIYNCNFSGLSAAICRNFENDKIHGYRPVNHSQGGLVRSPWARLGFRLAAMRAATPLNLVDFWANFTENPADPRLVNPMAKSGGRGLGVVLAGRESRRSLPPRVYAPIIETIFRLLNGPAVRLFGSQTEQAAARDLMRRFSPGLLGKTADLSGRTNWADLARELTGLDLVLTPDTGVMHFAAFLGVPVMAFFLSSALCHETGPYGRGHIVWQAAESCSPCLESAPCANNVSCLKPFGQNSFGRSLAQALLKKPFNPPLPENLQCWQGETDSLGMKLILSGGKDNYANARNSLRNIIARWLHIPGWNDLQPSLHGGEQTRLMEKAVPEEEWMLPPDRYC